MWPGQCRCQSGSKRCSCTASENPAPKSQTGQERKRPHGQWSQFAPSIDRRNQRIDSCLQRSKPVEGKQWVVNCFFCDESLSKWPKQRHAHLFIDLRLPLTENQFICLFCFPSADLQGVLWLTWLIGSCLSYHPRLPCRWGLKRVRRLHNKIRLHSAVSTIRPAGHLSLIPSHTLIILFQPSIPSAVQQGQLSDAPWAANWM